VSSKKNRRIRIPEEGRDDVCREGKGKKYLPLNSLGGCGFMHDLTLMDILRPVEEYPSSMRVPIGLLSSTT
jgi:hypothetical protein